MFKKLAKISLVVTACISLAMPAFARGVTPIQGSGTASAINAFQFAGTGQLRIGQDMVAESSLATLIALGPGPGHSLIGQSTHTLDLGARGTITTLDDLKLVPVNDTGLFQLSIRAEIVGGTGDFAGASGKLSFNGTANLVTGEVTWMVHGHVN